MVTGAARGIGRAVVERLRADGWTVVALDRLGRDAGAFDATDATDVAGAPDGFDALGGSDGVIACDMADPDAIARVAAAVGPVDLLVNNAGIWRFGHLEDVPVADIDDVLAVNLRGPLLAMQAFVRPMLERGRGAIVNVVSSAAAQVNTGVGIYAASKAGLLALTRQAALEWGPRGIRVNAVGPGLVPTEGTAAVYDDPEVRRVRAGAVPLRRLGTPADVAEVVAFLGSERAAYVSGQVLYVDGGLTQSLMTLLPRPPGTAGPSAE